MKPWDLMKRMGLAVPAASGYWDPAKKGAAVTLSEAGNRLASVVGASWNSVLSVTGHGAGRHYAEVQRVGGTYWAHTYGVGTATSDLTNYADASSDEWALQNYTPDGAKVLTSGSYSPASIGIFADGSYARIAWDADAGQLWLGNASVWHGGGDPAAGTGQTCSITPGTVLFVTAGIFGESARLRTAVGDFVGTPPAGFSAWG